jgi:hypothetical protein
MGFVDSGLLFFWDHHPEIIESLTALLERYKEEGRKAPVLK